jgi:hypothetical protein
MVGCRPPGGIVGAADSERESLCLHCPPVGYRRRTRPQSVDKFEKNGTTNRAGGGSRRKTAATAAGSVCGAVFFKRVDGLGSHLTAGRQRFTQGAQSTNLQRLDNGQQAKNNF